MTRPARYFPALLALAAFCCFGSIITPVFAQGDASESASQKAFSDAEQMYQDGKWAEALAAFQKFEQQYKFSTGVPQAIYYEGWCWFNMKRYQEAIGIFTRLTKSFPTAPIVPQAMLKQAEAYRELPDFDKAIQLYRTFQTQYPKSVFLPQAMMGEAWTLFKKGDLNNAKEVLQRIRTQYADDPTVVLDSLFLLGQILTAEKNYDGARAIYKQIASQRTNPRATEGLFLAGEAMFDAKRYADAILYYQQVQSKTGVLEKIRAEMAQLEAQRAQYLQRGGLLLYQNQMESLRAMLNKFQTGPDLRPSALFRIANCYQATGRTEEASVVYRYFLDVYPNDKLAEQAQFSLIQTLTERKQLEQADAQLKDFQKKHPNSLFTTDAMFLQAETMFGSGQYADALERYQKFAETNKNPQLVETAEFRIASCYYGLGQFEKARDSFMAFLQKNRQSRLVPEALFRLGRSHFELSQKTSEPKVTQANLTDAAKYFDQIRVNFPNSELLPEVTFQLGYLYSYLGPSNQENYAKAVATFEEFAKRWPEHQLVPEALYQIARNNVALGKTEPAATAYRQLVERFPENKLAPFAAYEIAGVYASAKQPPAMTTALRDYVTRYPDHTQVGNAYFAIGSELENQKKPDEAIAAYRELIDRAVGTTDRSDELRNAAIAAQVRISNILEQRADITGAVQDCEGFLSKFANEPIAARTIIAQIASIYRKAKKLPDAYAKLDQLAAQYQQNATIRIATTTSTAELALSENDSQRAYAAAAKLLADPEKDNLPASSYLIAGNTLLKREQFPTARDVFQKALAKYAGDTRTAPLAYLGLGQALLGLKQFDQAAEQFNQMIAADPQHAARPEAELGLAHVYEAQGKTKDAVDLYNKVMAAGRGEPAADAAFRLARLAFAQKDYKVALAYYLRVALMTGGEMGEEAAYRAAQCHEGLGNTDAARNGYQAYLRRFPTGKFADEAKAKLSTLPAAVTPG